MSKTISLLILLCGLAGATFSQEKNCCVTKAEVVLAKNRPTVYISFERMNKQDVVLRIHNNSRWAIEFRTLDFFDFTEQTKYSARFCDGRQRFSFPDGIEVNALYQVEAIPPPMARYTLEPDKSGDVKAPIIHSPDHGVSSSPLLSGRSVLFKVRSEHLIKPFKIYISYRYEWETTEHDDGNQEPEHRVYYSWHDLSGDKNRKAKLPDIIESNVTAMLPEFALEHRMVNEHTAGFVWAHNKDFVFVWIEFYQTTERARDAFISKPESARMEGFKVNVLERRVPNLGYETYWSEDVPSAKRGLHFYRGKIGVLITAPSDEMAERVARQVDLLLPNA